jgi:hypothetical protein
MKATAATRVKKLQVKLTKMTDRFNTSKKNLTTRIAKLKQKAA